MDAKNSSMAKRYRFARIRITKYTEQQKNACYKMLLTKGGTPDGFARLIVLDNWAHHTVACEDLEDSEHVDTVSSDEAIPNPKNRKRIELFVNRRNGNPIESWQWYNLLGLFQTERNVSIEPTSKKEYDVLMEKFKEEMILFDKSFGDEVYGGPKRELRMLISQAKKMHAPADVETWSIGMVQSFLREKMRVLEVAKRREDNTFERYKASLDQGNVKAEEKDA